MQPLVSTLLGVDSPVEHLRCVFCFSLRFGLLVAIGRMRLTVAFDRKFDRNSKF